ncbi:uncharacterized protein LOC129601928 [Paramacrobiotus metropolitanus]|uniref:uncharacterized protein LOC129601928 n=1 Tax=Paramacrobiotus metropolitanus TaxID=2943436 RepID=UPI0024457809|nr:uncharacterized protein LOC129601928 [Paramacrobiotus metropolitanus]
MSSRQCFVDCTNPLVYNVACEDIKGSDLFNDLKDYKTSSQPIHLAIWNSPGLSRISGVMLDPVANEMLRLEVDNLETLEYFPELRPQYKLKELVLMNCPKLKEMPLELLPPSIEQLTLFKTGITDLWNDFEEAPSLPLVHEFTLSNMRIESIQSGYFKAFPNLDTLQILNSELALTAPRGDLISALKPLKRLRITNNTLPSGSHAIIYEGAMAEMQLAENAYIDLSSNYFEMRNEARALAGKFQTARYISLKDNSFQDFATTANVFTRFTHLEYLDLANTNFFIATGSLAGLPSLKELYLGSNRMRDLTVTNIFQGALFRNLTRLDLSDNELKYLPIGVQPFADSLEELILRGNQMKLPEIFTSGGRSYVTSFDKFTNLKRLDLSYNKLVKLNSLHLSRIKKLQSLNLGCNDFRRIDKAFFNFLPRSLQILNLTFCLYDQGVHFENDPLLTMPPISKLIMQQGQLTSAVFAIFKKAHVEKLSELDLGYNNIAIIDSGSFEPLWMLETLKLTRNRMQSIGPLTFANMDRLLELDLSWNKIYTVTKDDFAGLYNLKTLTLTGNSIASLQAGALDPLNNLNQLYLGLNLINGDDLTTVFSKAGDSLIHLGLQSNPVRCIPGSLFGRLRKLRWLYLNSSRAISLDVGSFRNQPSRMSKYPFRLWAFKEPELSDIGCQSWEDWATAFRRYMRQSRISVLIINMSISVNIASAVIICILLPLTHGQCPSMASRRCFVDCTNPLMYNVACEDIKGSELFNDISDYGTSSQPIHLAIWDSPTLSRITAIMLQPIANEMTRFELDNMESLEYFPELKLQYLLKELVLMNCPKVKDMPLELLPPSIEQITLFRTGITELWNDFEETPALLLVWEFTLASMRIDNIQPGYFRAFPNLQSLQITDSKLFLKVDQDDLIGVLSPLQHLRITNNTLPPDTGAAIYEGIMTGLRIAEKAHVDLSQNNFEFRTRAKKLARKFELARCISLRDNSFEDFASTAQAFTHFVHAENLDLTNTNFLIATGSLAGLPRLQQLLLGHNSFQDLTATNIFQGALYRNLTFLDLSYNNLHYLPIGVEPFADSLEELVLRGNRLRLPEMYNLSGKSYVTGFEKFKNLRRLDLSYNHLLKLNSVYLSRIKRLQSLNLGCNDFRRIGRTFFNSLPRSLETLNITFCFLNLSVQFEKDALLEMPPISKLIMQKGQLTGSIFEVFKAARVKTLAELDLGYNRITNLYTEGVEPLSMLEILKLNNNQLQSIGPNAFSKLDRLVQLDLSWNSIHTIAKDDFAGLSNLRTLTLTGNSVMVVQAGTLDPLTNLQQLYLGYNAINGDDLAILLNNVGDQLIHLGLQYNPIQCIPGRLLRGMKRLKWLYLNRSRAINLDVGSFRTQPARLARHPFRLWAFSEPLLSDIGCQSWDDWATAFRKASKFVLKDRSGAAFQQMLINFPSCHMVSPRQIKKYIENIIC